VNLVVVTPVGPGHAAVSMDCAASVTAAWATDRGPFTAVAHECRSDAFGERGRSRTRNDVVAMHPEADWFFFIDADDLLHPEAFARFGAVLDADIQAVFGAVTIDWRDHWHVIPENVYPLDWRGLLDHGAAGTLSMGCFVRGDAAGATPFNDEMDAGEDFDFYLRLLHGRRWTKLREPLVLIRRSVPSAGGPRGYKTLDWRAACRAVVDKWNA